MALVRVTGNAWDHSQQIIPDVLQPRLFAKPPRSRIQGALLAGVESPAYLSATTGAFAVWLESDLDYQMVMDYLIPGQETEPPAQRARGYIEWPVFNSGGGGDISTLFPPAPAGTIFAALGKPPVGTSGITWIDLTDVNSDGALVYSPERG